jgi:type II secretory pathway pseudopilin PulG
VNLEPSKTRQSGMTLVEITLALALMALLGLFVTGVVRSVLGIWQTAERQGRGDLAFNSCYELMAADVSALHTGPRGWLVLDQWEALPAGEDQPAWLLPRLRFLARAEGLPDNPGLRGGMEVMWTLVPENATNSRLCRLMRVTQPENSEESLQSDRYASSLLRGGGGIAVLDGVPWVEWIAMESNGDQSSITEVAAESPTVFPVALQFNLERIAGSARERPPSLDETVASSQTRFKLRGTMPLRASSWALVDFEWVEWTGTGPQISIKNRGERSTVPSSHDRGASVFFPRSFTAKLPLSAKGRRIQP